MLLKHKECRRWKEIFYISNLCFGYCRDCVSCTQSNRLWRIKIRIDSKTQICYATSSLEGQVYGGEGFRSPSPSGGNPGTAPSHPHKLNFLSHQSSTKTAPFPLFPS